MFILLFLCLILFKKKEYPKRNILKINITFKEFALEIFAIRVHGNGYCLIYVSFGEA